MWNRLLPRRVRGRVSIVLAALGGAAIIAQQPTFRTAIEVVLIDVTVVNRTSAPAADLTAEDFLVTVDRTPRKVVSAAFVAFRGQRGTAGRTAEPARPPDDPAAAPPAPGRNILIAVDEDSLGFSVGPVARRAAMRFLDGLPTADRVGVLPIPRLKSGVELTTDRAPARKVLDAIVAGPTEPVPGSYWIGLQEAFDMERRDTAVSDRVIRRECASTIDPVMCPEAVRLQARLMVLQAQARSQASIDAVQQIADTFRKVPGPKTLVLVSGGMTDPEMFSAYSRLADALAAAQISLYTVFIERMHLGEVATKPSPTQLEDDRLQSNGVENLTASAGGTVMRVAGQVEAGFDRVASEMSGSYLLGIEVAASDRDGKPHRVEVKVGRPGLEVRARKQYVIEPASARLAGPGAPRPAPPPATKPPNPARDLGATPAGLDPLLARAAAYVTAYEGSFLALLSDERNDQAVFGWKAAPDAPRGAWVAEARRQIASDYLIVKAPSGVGWVGIRDVYEVDGRQTREHTDRLRQIFLESPDDVLEAARTLSEESAGHDIGFVQRNTNVPTSALLFVHAVNQPRFVFASQGEQVQDGIRVVLLAFAERQSPTLIRGDGIDLPAEGVVSIDPQTGRVLKSVLRLDIAGTLGEITVTYRPTSSPGGPWVPVEMSEVYTDGPRKLECRARYGAYRKFE
jgi:VWFA-related protein